jgi:DNA-binding winged helix-turn-helix (wHTH) protein
MNREVGNMADPRQDLRDFQLAEWLVQPSLDQLTSGSAVVRIRPQLMDLLVCLAARAGRTVARQELAAAIWPNQFIADSGLARCVAELRRALGDSARQPRIIETIPKRGYRVIAAVSPADVLPVAEHGTAGPTIERADERSAGIAAAREIGASDASPLSPFGRTIARLSVVAMAVGARLWRRRPIRPSGPGGLGAEAPASAARAL